MQLTLCTMLSVMCAHIFACRVVVQGEGNRYTKLYSRTLILLARILKGMTIVTHKLRPVIHKKGLKSFSV